MNISNRLAAAMLLLAGCSQMTLAQDSVVDDLSRAVAGIAQRRGLEKCPSEPVLRSEGSFIKSAELTCRSRWSMTADDFKGTRFSLNLTMVYPDMPAPVMIVDGKTALPDANIASAFEKAGLLSPKLDTVQALSAAILDAMKKRHLAACSSTVALRKTTPILEGLSGAALDCGSQWTIYSQDLQGSPYSFALISLNPYASEPALLENDAKPVQDSDIEAAVRLAGARVAHSHVDSRRLADALAAPQF